MFWSGSIFRYFFVKNFKTTKPKNSSKHNIQTWKNVFHDFFLKKNNLTVLDDLAAVTRMTGGLNVGGNQTFPGPFYVRWATLSYSYIRLHCTVSDEFEHDWRGAGVQFLLWRAAFRTRTDRLRRFHTANATGQRSVVPAFFVLFWASNVVIRRFDEFFEDALKSIRRHRIFKKVIFFGRLIYLSVV